MNTCTILIVQSTKCITRTTLKNNSKDNKLDKSVFIFFLDV